MFSFSQHLKTEKEAKKTLATKMHTQISGTKHEALKLKQIHNKMVTECILTNDIIPNNRKNVQKCSNYFFLFAKFASRQQSSTVCRSSSRNTDRNIEMLLRLIVEVAKIQANQQITPLIVIWANLDLSSTLHCSDLPVKCHLSEKFINYD